MYLYSGYKFIIVVINSTMPMLVLLFYIVDSEAQKYKREYIVALP
jgi:hypothetical protein